MKHAEMMLYGLLIRMRGGLIEHVSEVMAIN